MHSSVPNPNAFRLGSVILKTVRLAVLASALTSHYAFAGSATWKSNANTTEWDRATNWLPRTIPNGPSDVATFATSKIPEIIVSTDIEVSQIVFNPGATIFSVTSAAQQTLTISGTGVINNSGRAQHIIAKGSGVGGGASGTILFTNSAAAGVNTFFQATKPTDLGGGGGTIEFFDNSSADHASFEISDDGALNESAPGSVIFNPGSTAGNATFIVHDEHRFTGDPGLLEFDGASAGNATITTDGGDVFFSQSGAGSSIILNEETGTTTFSSDSSAEQATITNQGESHVGYLSSGSTFFELTGTAGTATIVNEGGNGDGTLGAVTSFSDTATAGNAVLIATAGTDGGGGGEISFHELSEGGTAQVQVFGNGTLDITDVNGGTSLTIGSLEGDGLVNLGDNTLAIGSANHNTDFAGTIEGTGAVMKVGTGRLTLSGASNYIGGTTISQGTIVVSNTFGSATGVGPLKVDGGTLSGTGIIAGNVTLGTGRGTGAKLLTGRQKFPGTITLQSQVTFNSDSSLGFVFDSSQSSGGMLIARGARIQAGALFTATDNGDGFLPTGTVFTVISNTAVQPIGGAFSNLADGETITVGSNTFQADYESADGNDLTLTVVP